MTYSVINHALHAVEGVAPTTTMAKYGWGDSLQRQGQPQGLTPSRVRCGARGEVAWGAELRPCVWGRCHQPVLLLWGQHPHPPHGEKLALHKHTGSFPAGGSSLPPPGWG